MLLERYMKLNVLIWFDLMKQKIGNNTLNKIGNNTLNKINMYLP